MLQMSAINPNQFNVAQSPQDLLDESLANSVFGAGEQSQAQQAASADEPPQEQALQEFNDLTHAAQNQFTKELDEKVPAELLDAQQMTSTLNTSIVASGTEALAAAAQKLNPDAAFALLQP